jgi:NlpC/P60 family putative phage cell wall peptidase
MTIERSYVVAEALSWLGTPFHHAARVKGCGVDCVNLLVAVFSATGVCTPFSLPSYAQDWHIHNGDALFLHGLANYADKLAETDSILPGDIVMFKYGRHAAHGAIIVEYPQVVHAWKDAGSVVLSNVAVGPLHTRVDSFWRMRGLA